MHGGADRFVGDPDTACSGPVCAAAAAAVCRYADDWRITSTGGLRFHSLRASGRAFERLSTKHRDRPQPTWSRRGPVRAKPGVLLPVLDHVLRARKAGVTGMKALILSTL